MAFGKNTVEILIKAKNLSGSAFSGINQSLSRLHQNIFSVRTALAGLGVGLVLRSISKSFLEASNASEQYRVRLNILLRSQEEGNRLFKEMADYAGKVPFQYEEIMGAATQLAGVMKGGVNEIKQWMPLIGDLAAASGLGIQQTTEQVIRMYSAGAASADLFRERGILAMLGFQAGVSVSAEKTREQLMAAWSGADSQFRGSTDALAGTWTGMTSMIADKWFAFRNKVMDSAPFDFLKSALDLLNKKLGEIDLDKLAEKIGKGFIDILKKVLIGTADLIDKLTPIIEVIWHSIKTMWDEFLKLPDWVRNIGIVGALIGGKKGLVIIGGLLQLLDAGKTSIEGLSQAWKGNIDWTELATMNHKELAAKLQELKDKGIIPAEEALAGLSDIDAGKGKLGTSLRKLITDIEANAEAMKKTAPEKKGGGGGAPGATPEPTVSPLAAAEADLIKTKAKLETQLVNLESLLSQGKKSLSEYFAERLQIMNEGINKEIEILRLRESKEEDIDKRAQINAQIIALEEKRTQEIIKLRNQELEAEERIQEKKRQVKDILDDLRKRAAPEVESQYAQELAALDEKNRDEIQKIEEALAAKELIKEKETAINEAYRLQELEKDKLLADQQKRLAEQRIETASQIAGGMKQIFTDLYEAGDKKNKDMFRAAKAAAMAETIINTAAAAMKAYKEGGAYLGPALAAIIVAAGGVQLGKIAAQQLAAGGKVFGSSPSETADNIPIMATAGEFMQPVSSVKYYGAKIMEAMRRNLIPREMFSDFRVQGLSPYRPAYAFASGGEISPQPERKQKQQTNIINLIDPNLFDQYLATSAGQQSIINVLHANNTEVKRVVSS